MTTLQGTVNSARINQNQIKLDIDTDLDLNKQQDNYKLDVQQAREVKPNTSDPETSDVQHTVTGEETTELRQPTQESSQAAMGLARQRESLARSHFLSQAGINRENLTEYNFRRNENGSTTETFRGQFDDQGGIDTATYNSQVQQKLNGDNLSTNIQSQGQITYTGLNKDEAEASQLDVTVSPLVDPEQISPMNQAPQSNEPMKLDSPPSGEPLELTEAQKANYGQNIYVNNDTAVGPGVQGEAVEQHQRQVRDNLLQMGITEENAGRLLGTSGPEGDGVDGFYGPKTEQTTEYIEGPLRNQTNAGIQFDTNKLNEAIAAKDFDPESFDPSKFVSSYGEHKPGDQIALEDGSSVTVPRPKNRRRFKVEDPLNVPPSDPQNVDQTSTNAVENKAPLTQEEHEDIVRRSNQLSQALGKDNFDPNEAVSSLSTLNGRQLEALNEEYKTANNTTITDAIANHERLNEYDQGLLTALADPNRPSTTESNPLEAQRLAGRIESALQRKDADDLHSAISGSSPYELRQALHEYGPNLDRDLDNAAVQSRYNGMLKQLASDVRDVEGTYNTNVSDRKLDAIDSARRFNEALSFNGLDASTASGIDKNAAQDLLNGMSGAERTAFIDEFKTIYGQTPAEALPMNVGSQQYRDGLNQLLQAPREREATNLNLLRDAGRLQQAFDGRGRNEGTLNELILSSSPEYLHRLNETFEKEFGRTIQDAISKDAGFASGFRGDYQALLKQALDNAPTNN